MAWTTPMTWLTGFANRATAALFNQQLRDNLNYLYRAPARKTANQSVTSSTALISDTHLLIPLAASELYEFECILFFTAATAGDLKVAWNVPSGATGAWGGLGPDATTPSVLFAPSFAAFGDGTTAIFGGNAGNEVVFLQGVVVNSSTPGNLQLRWAQGTSSGTSTTLFTNSHMLAHRL